MQALAVLAVTLLVTPALGARQLQQAVTDADIYNFALNLEYLEVSPDFKLSSQLMFCLAHSNMQHAYVIHQHLTCNCF